MTVKAVKSFSGERFNMHVGEVREVNDTETVRDLIRIGYLEDVGGSQEPPVPEQTADDTGTEETPPEQTEVQLNEAKRGKSKRN